MVLPTLFTVFASDFDSSSSILVMSRWYYPTSGSIPPDGDQRYWGPFKWTNPSSWADGRAGRFCSQSHAWFPGHLVREVDGAVFGEPFAPEEKGL